MSKIPKLRFKEFSGEWESKKLGQLLEFKNGINASKEQYGYGKKFINVLDILNNDYITHENIIGKVDIDDDTFEKYSVGYGDVVFQRSSETREEVGTANIYLDKEHKATFGGFIIRGKKIGEYSPIFMNKLLKTSSSRKEITSKSGGSTRYNVGQETLSEVSLLFPKIEEQEKIASFFSLIDDKISLQGEKIEALKDYKKGMMQKIFSRELRFKDDNGRDYPEWEERKLGDLIRIKSNRNKNSIVGLVLSVSNTKGFITQSEQFEDRVVASSDISNYKIVEKDDFAFNPARINVGSIARLKLYDKGIISPMYICFKCLNSVESDYLEYFLMTYSFNVQMKKKLEGSVRQTLSAEALGEIVINLPCLNEQKKISEFLNTINNKLVKEQDKLDCLNEYKKGLLQQMFI